MKHFLIKAFDIPDAWTQVLETIYLTGDEFQVEHGSEITETKKIAATIDIERPENRPLTHHLAPFSAKYIEQYTLEYLFIGEKHEKEDYTYGERLRKPVDQIQKVIDRYRKYKGDRQNTMLIRRPEDLDIEYPPCLTVLDTEILENKLHFIVYFRSWDAYGGFPANVAGLQLLKEDMAEEIGVQPGKTIAYAKNLHLYERQYKLVEEMLKPKK
jgi:thymidylate synthase